jgi:alpha/beta hydrolase family protein
MLLKICAVLLLFAHVAAAEVVGIDVRRRDDYGTHERVIGRVRFAIDPKLPANRAIADVDLAPTNAAGKVEFSSDFLFFRPKDADRARGTVFLEVVNRGRDQSLGIMSGAVQRSALPESWNLGDGFLLAQGFAVAFLGWQFDVAASQGLTFQAPVAPVEGIVRETDIEVVGGQTTQMNLTYCAIDPRQSDATLTYRARMDAEPRLLSRETWQFAGDGCSVRLRATAGRGIYEVVYRTKGSPVAGLGLAAIRDFASYLRYGGRPSTLRETPAALRHVIGYGYSQSGRLLREFVRDGFNADERGRAAFDALMISSAGAGGGSFNHRFAMPGVAGNSVLSVLRPVDLPPFTDEGLLARAEAARVTPKIFYTFTSTEYWARAGSLTHSTDDGRSDVPLAAASRLYFLAGTPHASGQLSLVRGGSPYQHFPNFAEQGWVARALLLDLDAWAATGTQPPPSQYPTIDRGELVALKDVHFPAVPALPFAEYVPAVWRMDFGPDFRAASAARVISIEPPRLGEPYPVLVPQVNADGNDVSGIRLPEVAVPLGTYTGWNVTIPQLRELRYLSGLVGGFEPFPLTREQRERSGDARLSIAERYRDRQDYLDRVRRASDDLVRQKFLLRDDVRAVVQRAGQIWDAVVGAQR